MAKICAETACGLQGPIACPALCTLHIENACSIDRLFLKCTLMEQSLRKFLERTVVVK